MIGTLLNNTFRIRTFNRFVCFLIGSSITYGLSNPDIDTVYEFFPVFKQNKFAYLTFLQVDEKDDHIFEERLKDLCRFYQKQQGYLYTKIIKKRKDKKENTKEEEQKKLSEINKIDSFSIDDIKLKHKNQDEEKSKYIIISTWLKNENFLLASNRMYGRILIDKIKKYANYNPYLYKIVVNDMDYLPPL